MAAPCRRGSGTPRAPRRERRAGGLGGVEEPQPARADVQQLVGEDRQQQHRTRENVAAKSSSMVDQMSGCCG